MAVWAFSNSTIRDSSKISDTQSFVERLLKQRFLRDCFEGFSDDDFDVF